LSEAQPITPAGFAAMRARYEELFTVERPKIVEVVSWAAGNGDRSENGDYIYGRQRLRQIDRELSHLARRMKAVTIVDPAQQADSSRVRFGTTVTIVDDDDVERTVTLVGEDEADATAGRISWKAPLSRALRGATLGDLRIVDLPGGSKSYEVIAISSPD
jgi:transcription elongation factor GreB